MDRYLDGKKNGKKKKLNIKTLIISITIACIPK